MKKRILVVDDEPDVNLALKEALEENGLKVDAFNDSLLALENFEAGSYDLLILDIRMPKMNGFELYKEIKRIDDAFNDSLLALENFEAGSYDLLILDIRMPKMNGFELYKEIKRIDDKVKVCFLTAGEMPYGIYQDIFDKNEFIRKPIENQELLSRLDRILNS